MMSKLPMRTVGFVAMAAVTIGCCLLFSQPATNSKVGVVVWLPPEVPGYRSERGEMGEKEQEWLPEDTTFLKMTYLENGLPEDVARYRAVHATLIVAGADSRSLHRPRVCLGAQGWAIKKALVVTVETAGGPLRVMDYSLARFVRNKDLSIRLNEDGSKRTQRAHYFYWWIGPNASTPSDEEKVWKSLWSSILNGENERWAYPSVLTLVDERYGDAGVEEARSRALGFIGSYAPSFQKSLGAQDREDAVKLKTF